jgi:DNA polymerase-3 subunit delta'
LLRRAIARGTLPPSLIFSGPPGVGKSRTAVALVQTLNCERVALAGGERDRSPDACGQCGACRRIARAAAAFDRGERPAIDVLQWLAPDEKASIKIDPVRQVLRRAGYRPFDGRHRVIVIDGAEALEVAAQQALLKMLEEPPAATSFVLITPHPDVLLPTIRSRCPQLRFGPLSPAQLAQALVERFGWTLESARAAAALADGSLERALSDAESDARGARDIAAQVLRQVARSRGPAERLQAGQTLALCGESGRGAGDGGRGRTATASREELSARLDAMSALLRDIGVLSSRADRGRLANADLSSALDGLAPAFAGRRLTRAFTVVDDARAALGRNANQKVVADWLVLRL